MRGANGNGRVPGYWSYAAREAVDDFDRGQLDGAEAVIATLGRGGDQVFADPLADPAMEPRRLGEPHCEKALTHQSATRALATAVDAYTLSRCFSAIVRDDDLANKGNGNVANDTSCRGDLRCGCRMYCREATAVSRKRYVGPIPHLIGKSALVEPRVGAAGEVMAQFEESYLQEARGWWQFSEADFEVAGSKRDRQWDFGRVVAEVPN